MEGLATGRNELKDTRWFHGHSCCGSPCELVPYLTRDINDVRFVSSRQFMRKHAVS